jgi:DNA-binding CsgD family transcriptional regulator
VLDDDDSRLAVVGLTSAEERVYRNLVRRGRTTTTALEADQPEPAEAVRDHLRRLHRIGLVELDGEEVRARPPAEVLPRLVEEQAHRLRSDSERPDAVRNLVPELSAAHEAAKVSSGKSVTIDRVQGDDIAELLEALAATSTGDLLWLRPDPWQRRLGPQVDETVLDLLAAGRRSRAIYPARVLEKAPLMILDRADAGEHVRILAEVPVRLAVMGRTAAVIGEESGPPTVRRLVVREQSLVRALALLFECLWERAVPLPGFDGRSDDGEQSQQRLLLGLLARGGKDEQIARALGVSVRTVRRRVADLLVELDADSRFQAGVEAVRRGWA